MAFSQHYYNCPCCNDRVWVYGIGMAWHGSICLDCRNKHGNYNAGCYSKQVKANQMDYIIINGKNGSSYSINSTCKAGDTLTEYNDKNYTINAITLGPSNRYAVCNSLGGSGWCFGNSDESGKSFHTRMDKIDASEIRNISFGPNNTWSIVDNDGWCYYHTYGKNGDKSGPSKAIDEHNGKIKYVSMTANKSEWIVGYGYNGYVGYGLANNVTKAIKEADDGEIEYVKLGKKSSLYVIKHSNGWSYGYDNDEFAEKMKKFENKRLVAIW